MATSETWSDPQLCPFCETTLASPGAGFIDHLAEAPGCRREFESWRARVDDDLIGEWGG